ncbi:hypothetical protein Achl_4146 (plasmid) [Pseudarthrobacter chlorophenolicus A6]|uniref:Uncharacterized protein n=1 Tax=Pseudarthrobacter chlorophenolicus (strain ATCC 700700 / DSM 12829 / CIP 107037 / JCM 12360 / KCTC 9906 / NCIMB 13794 / A6) TaxID=452863 RepID=B8HI50_PSECP|nr:A24 family peptidase [Pseudarthrobacter chlorophenolicus]ACL42097.1 hypothetical protein Achl_4146 [Pseudarthrobacter chlorophenolicus A6]SDQ13391.1 hypothetical protein SAMN04489738_0205 [Pseudarthrobacter chlorophenolicus]
MTTVLTDTVPIDIQPEALLPTEHPDAEEPAPLPSEAAEVQTEEDYLESAMAHDTDSAEVREKLEDESEPYEVGLRPLTGQDWLVATVWGIVGALATTAVSVLFLPVHLLSLTFVLGAGLGLLGYLDHCTQLIRNRHNLVFGAAAALLLVATQVISPAGAILVPALIGGAASFGFMLVLAVFTKFAGGGDIKLSPIPAALLAAVSPIAAMMWLLFTFTLCLVAMVTARLAGSKTKHVAMAPFMAVAAVLAIGVYGSLAQVLGI